MPPSQPGGFQPGAAPYGSAPPAQQSNGLAIASLITGIIGLLTFWACGAGGALGIIAVVLGFLGLKKAKEMDDNGKGLAIGGIVTGGIAIIAGVAIFLAWVVFADSVENELDDFQQQLEEDFGEINSDPSDGVCDEDRFIQDPDC